MVQHGKFALLARIVMAACGAGLLLPVLSGGFGAHAQVAPAPPGHRQPKAADLPKEPSAKDTPRNPEDIVLERALNNICRGCSPIIPVRSVPRYSVAQTCPASLGEGTDRCRQDEETARQRLADKWTTFTDKARSDCVQTNEIGGRPSYVQLSICLAATQIAPTLPEGR
jgi:hypothetical protein